MSTLGLVLRNIKITWSICYKCRFPRLISCLLKPSLMAGPRWFFMLLNSLHYPWEGPWVNFSTRTAYGRSGFLSRRRRPQDRLIAEEKCDEPGWWCSSVLPAPAFALPENMLEVQTFMSCPRATQSQKHWRWASIWLNEILCDSDACCSARISAHHCKGLSA